MRRLLLLAAAATAGTLLISGTAPAGAATVRPAAPTRVHVVALSSTGITVAAARAAHATGYRLFVSTRRSDLTAAHLSAARASALRRSPRLTVRHLTLRTAPYYFRVESRNGRRYRLEKTVHAVYLRPAVPTRPAVGRPGPYLTWRAGLNTGFVVDQATNRSMTAGRRTYRLRALVTQFTPYGLTAGRTYWFRVSAVNGGTRSAATTPVTVKATSRQQPMSVMTYNVLEANTAGQMESGSALAPWSARRAGVVALVRRRHPDVLAVQEAAAFIGPPAGYGGTRQVDDLAKALGPGYALARTEVPPSEHGYQRTADYLLYRTAAWTAVGAGGHWSLGDGRWAAYQVLRSRYTGARVLVVSIHLLAGGTTGSADRAHYDTVRERETQSLLRQAAAFNTRQLPVVYAGDLNSDVNRNHVFDGPGLAMRAAHATDAERVAQRQVNGRYNSSNLNLRRPPAVDQSIDYVYAGPGVAVTSREVVVALTAGRFAGVIPSDHNPVLAQTYVPY